MVVVQGIGHTYAGSDEAEEDDEEEALMRSCLVNSYTRRMRCESGAGSLIISNLACT